MKLQPLLAIVLALAVGGCATNQTGVVSDTASVPSSLYSEFKNNGAEASFYGPFLAASQAQQDAHHRDAAKFYVEALESDPSSAFVAERAFFQLLYSGQVEKAAEVATSLIEQGDGTEDDLIRMVYVLAAYKGQQWPEVRERLAEHLNTGFGNLISPILSGWSHAAEGNVDKGHEALKSLSSHLRYNSLADEHSAYMADYTGNFDEAEKRYVAVINSKRLLSVQPIIAYGHMLYQAKQRKKALDMLVEQAKKHNSQAYLVREGRNITLGKKPTQLAASPIGAASMMLFRFGIELEQNNAPQSAIIYLRLAQYLAPTVEETHFRLGDLFVKSENIEEAIASYNLISSESRLFSLVESQKITAYRALGKLDLAEALIRKALIKTPNDTQLLINLADILQVAGNHADAVIFYTKAINNMKQKGRVVWYAYFGRGFSYEQLNDWPSAEADLMSALQSNPDEAVILNHLGYSWIDRGMRIEEAKGMIAKALALQPKSGAITDSMGWVLYLTGEYDEAVTYLEKAVRLEPDDATLNSHLGDAYWQVGRKIEARFQWQHALDSDPSDDVRKELVEKLEIGLPEKS